MTDNDETPYWVHDATTFKPLRHATVAEVKRAAVATRCADRFFDGLFFPLYYTAEKNNLFKWLTDNGAFSGVQHEGE